MFKLLLQEKVKTRVKRALGMEQTEVSFHR
jgi:hypothetical protein